MALFSASESQYNLSKRKIIIYKPVAGLINLYFLPKQGVWRGQKPKKDLLIQQFINHFYKKTKNSENFAKHVLEGERGERERRERGERETCFFLKKHVFF